MKRTEKPFRRLLLWIALICLLIGMIGQALTSCGIGWLDESDYTPPPVSDTITTSTPS